MDEVDPAGIYVMHTYRSSIGPLLEIRYGDRFDITPNQIALCPKNWFVLNWRMVGGV
jgi:hypothetical protein